MLASINGMKICNRCGVEKPIIEFNKNKGGEDGLYCWCKACTHKNSVKYYSENKEHVVNNPRPKGRGFWSCIVGLIFSSVRSDSPHTSSTHRARLARSSL
jgi:hypothetical protein